MFRIAFILRHGTSRAFCWMSSGTWHAASPITTSAKQTASTVGTVWQTATTDLPSLKPLLEALLQ